MHEAGRRDGTCTRTHARRVPRVGCHVAAASVSRSAWTVTCELSATMSRTLRSVASSLLSPNAALEHVSCGSVVCDRGVRFAAVGQPFIVFSASECDLGGTRFDPKYEPGIRVKREVRNGKQARFLVSTLVPLWFPSPS